MGIPLLLIIVGVGFLSSAIILLYPVIFLDGAQSVTAGTNICYSNGSDKYKKI